MPRLKSILWAEAVSSSEGLSLSALSTAPAIINVARERVAAQMTFRPPRRVPREEREEFMRR
jgi:hypothetical protein